jgi:hypothetical protein
MHFYGYIINKGIKLTDANLIPLLILTTKSISKLNSYS